ncbi:MAG: hypothetical protein ACLFO1_09995 [Spirochaetaceae bacterium]
MHSSERFLHKLRRIKKQGQESDADALRSQVDRAFSHSLPGLPSEMVEELFAHFYAQAVPEGTPFYIAVERLAILGDVVDLMFSDYDDESDPIGREDWEAIRDIVSSYAVDLDMGLVNYVMKRVLEHGQI